METIKVNMTPCEDVQTIHASQNDNEARKWGFELHNNGEKIDSSSISDQMVFKAYEGGTEQLLPTQILNGSVDMGDLTWSWASTNRFFYTQIADRKESTEVFTDKFNYVGIKTDADMLNLEDNSIAVNPTYIKVKCNQFNGNISDFTNYVKGTYLYYEKTSSTPTTSPFLGDIKYPQGLLTDQEFTYRQSPTESDGLAFIESIKGNTLVWNQQITDPNFTDVSKWRLNGNYTTAVANNELTLTVVSTDTNAFIESGNLPIIPNGHKFFFRMMVNPSVGTQLRVGYAGVVIGNPIISAPQNTWTEYKAIVTSTTSTTRNTLFYFNTQGSLSGAGATIKFKQATLIDLTLMFGSGNEPTTVEEFTSLFPLPYYAYNQGTLLSFNGNGIKTVGKNKFNITRNINVTIGGVTFKSNADKSITVNGTTTANATITQLNGFTVPNIKKGESLIWSGGLNRPVEQAYAQLVYNGDETGQTYSFVSVNNQSALINATESMTLSGVYISCRSGNTFNNETFYPMLRYANTDSSYEPYTSSTLSLPISTYFPSGMKSAGDVYDELTPSKAITRIGAVDLGTLSWDYDDTYSRFYSSDITDIKNTGQNVVPNLLVVNYRSYSLVDFNRNLPNMAISYVGSNGRLVMRNTSFTDATAFKTAMDGVYLYYELATPTETPITTASLVTENGEIPLSNEDGVLIGKCTEQLSAEPGFHDAKIKLADEDGECYSNKIQLHVERKPS